MDDDFFDLPDPEKQKQQEKPETKPTAPAPDSAQQIPQYYPPRQAPAVQPSQAPVMPYSEQEARTDQYKAGFNDGYYTGYTNALRDHPSFSLTNERRAQQSFVFGLISIFTLFIPFISIGASVAAIVLALQSKNQGKIPQRGVYGLILGICAAVLVIIALVIAMTYLQTPEGQKFMENFTNNMTGV